MGRKINWTEPALEDLAAAVRYIAQDDPDAAIRVGEKIADHVELLESFPEIGPVYRRRSGADIRHSFLLHSGYFTVSTSAQISWKFFMFGTPRECDRWMFNHSK